MRVMRLPSAIAAAAAAAILLTAQTPSPPVTQVPAGDQIDVVFQSDVGSRLGKEGDSFAVETANDYSVRGRLILPKGSPGYGTIVHVKPAAAFHAGGELAIKIDRLVLPNGAALAVQIPGTIGDAQYVKEHNGSAAGRWLLCGVLCMEHRKGDDMLLKAGTHVHVTTLRAAAVPVVVSGTTPAPLPTPSPQPTAT